MGHNQSNHLLLGAILGGLLVGTSVSLISNKEVKKAGRKVKKRVIEQKDKIDNYIRMLEENIEKEIDEKAVAWYKKAKKALQQVKKELNSTFEEHNELKIGLLVGGILGTLIGVGFSHAFPRHAETSNIRNMGKKAEGWKNTIDDVMEIVDQHSESQIIKPQTTNTVHQAVDFIASGLQLWQSFRDQR